MAQQSLYDLLNGENASGNPDLGDEVANPQAVVGRSSFIEYFVGGGNTGGGIQNDTTQQNNVEDSSQVSNDMDDEIPF